MDNLYRRHIRNSPLCPICQSENETIGHALFSCANALRVWNVTNPLLSSVINPDRPFMDTVSVTCQTLNKEELSGFLARTWAIWSIWNERCFNSDEVNVEIMVLGYERLVLDFLAQPGGNNNLLGKCAGATHDQVASFSDWAPPNTGWFKLNTDAALGLQNEVVLGGVLRDDRGRIHATMVHRITAEWDDVLCAEAAAVAFGVQTVKAMGITRLAVETDNLDLAQYLRKRDVVNLSQLGLILEDILDITSGFVSILFTHVKLVGNAVAHWVARSGFLGGVESICTYNFPQSILALAGLDFAFE